MTKLFELAGYYNKRNLPYVQRLSWQDISKLLVFVYNMYTHPSRCSTILIPHHQTNHHQASILILEEHMYLDRIHREAGQYLDDPEDHRSGNHNTADNKMIADSNI